MRRKLPILCIMLFLITGLTGCMLDEGKYPFSTDEEVKAALEEEYEQEVTYIKQLSTENQTRYWEFGLENYAI